MGYSIKLWVAFLVNFEEPNPPMLHFHNREKLSFLSIYVVKIGTVMIDTTCAPQCTLSHFENLGR
jgi:hypothetical protein